MGPSEATPDQPELSTILPEANVGAGQLDWRRPHPMTIIIEIGNAIRSLIVPLVILRAGFSGASNLIQNAVIIAPLATAIARWYTTRYALDTESIFHQYGLVRRHKQVLPRANVQNLSTKAGIVARWGSVAELQISDASASGDISLRLISRQEADRLTTLLRSSIPQEAMAEADGGGPERVERTNIPAGDAPIGTPVEQAPLVMPTMSELFRAEITSMTTVALALSGVAGGLAATLLVWFRPALLPEDGAAPLILISFAVLVPLVIAGLNLASRLLVLGGYRLDRDPDRLRIQAGLLTEARVAARRERLQQIQVIRDLPHQWLGIERVKYETADVELNLTAATSYLDPAGTPGHWRQLATEAIGEVQVDEADLDHVSPLTKRRIWIRFAMVAPIVVVPVAVIHPLVAAVVGVAWAGFGFWYGIRRFQVLGWTTSDDQYLVRSGVVYQRLTLVRLDKIQNLRLKSTFFQRRLDLATVSVSTAGHGFVDLIDLPDLPLRTARELHDELATRVAQTPIAETL
ncbi:MAG: PH domain-containing protein [Actinomycetia bacterium]|nr:PH domain-containing protein [Actinomycetes bacterium]MCP5031322.1 PH domain-containing protein [Actinomycetes bacterium]